jgi:hypothetical protein
MLSIGNKDKWTCVYGTITGKYQNELKCMAIQRKNTVF